MALTFTKTDAGVFGDQKYWQGKVTFDSVYPTGGEAYTPEDFEMGQVRTIVLTPVEIQYRVIWDKANSTLMIVTDSLGSQVANGADMSATEVEVTVFGL